MSMELEKEAGRRKRDTVRIMRGVYVKLEVSIGEVRPKAFGSTLTVSWRDLRHAAIKLTTRVYTGYTWAANANPASHDYGEQVDGQGELRIPLSSIM
jgi:hypothetical protein